MVSNIARKSDNFLHECNEIFKNRHPYKVNALLFCTYSTLVKLHIMLNTLFF